MLINLLWGFRADTLFLGWCMKGTRQRRHTGGWGLPPPHCFLPAPLFYHLADGQSSLAAFVDIFCLFTHFSRSTLSLRLHRLHPVLLQPPTPNSVTTFPQRVRAEDVNQPELSDEPSLHWPNYVWTECRSCDAFRTFNFNEWFCWSIPITCQYIEHLVH